MSPGPQPSPIVAVTGATGFIGQRIVVQLLAQGFRVLALVRPQSVRRKAVPDGVEVHETRLDEADPRLQRALQDVDGVVYAAGAVRGRSLADFIPANVEGVRAVAAVLGRHKQGSSFVLVSSLAAGEPALSDYARSKREGERVLAAHGGSLRWAILRPTAVYGVGDRELTPLFSIMRRGLMVCPGGPAQCLSFIHVDDLARAVVAALEALPAIAGRTFALDDGTTGGYSRTAIAESLRPGRRCVSLQLPRGLLSVAARLNMGVSKVLGRAPMLTPGKVNELTHTAWLGDNAPFSAATGWSPRVNLASGARLCFESQARES